MPMRGVFLRMVALVEALRAAEAVVHVQVAGDRRHGAHLLAEVEAAIGRFDIGMAEVDQRDDVGVVDRLDRLGDLGRRLAVLAGLGGEDVLERDAHAIGLGELGELEQRFALAQVGGGAVEDLVGAQVAAVLDEDAGVDPVADLDQGLCGVELVAAGGRVHEVGRDEAVDGVAEVELARSAPRAGRRVPG